MNILELFHLIIFSYLSLGAYFIPGKYIPIYLLSLPYIVIDWNDKDGLCWVTKLTNMIKYKEINPEVENDIENSFVRKTLYNLGISIDEKKLTFLLYVIFIISWSYAYNRLIKKYKIEFFPNDMTKYISYTFIFLWLVITYI